MSEDRLLTIAEVAERVRCHRKTIERAIRAGRLYAVNVGEPTARRPEIRVRPSDYEAWLERCRVRSRERAVELPPPQATRRARRGTLRLHEGMGQG